MKSPLRNRQQSRRSPDDNSQLHTSLSQKKDSSKVWQLHSTCLIQRSCACGTAVIRPGIPRKKKVWVHRGVLPATWSQTYFFYVYYYILYILFYLLFPKVQEWELWHSGLCTKKQSARSVNEWRWITTKPSLTGCWSLTSPTRVLQKLPGPIVVPRINSVNRASTI